MLSVLSYFVKGAGYVTGGTKESGKRRWNESVPSHIDFKPISKRRFNVE